VPAEQGRLTIFASGPDEARARIAPLFDALAQRTVWVGPLGAGSRMKLVNNTLLAFKAEGLGTSIALALGVGLDVRRVRDALGPLLSPWDTAKLERMTRGEFSAEFALALALKDVHLALETVDRERFAAYTALAHEWEAAVDQGLGNEDVTSVMLALEGEQGKVGR
jgi:3-hydroxyisobutyrate dehydrogenase